jgi:hypothetical protein
MTRECLYVSILSEENSRKNEFIHADRRKALWGAGKPKKGAETRVSVCPLIVKEGQK